MHQLSHAPLRRAYEARSCGRVSIQIMVRCRIIVVPFAFDRSQALIWFGLTFSDLLRAWAHTALRVNLSSPIPSDRVLQVIDAFG